MSAHTPGPWLIQRGDEWADGIVTLHGHNEDGTPMYWTVASYNRRRDEAEANARLIAAAPELLEALKELIAAVDAIGERPSGELTPRALLEALFDAALGARMTIDNATRSAS